MPNRKEIAELLSSHDRPHLERDGATRVFAWVLSQNHVSYTVKAGRLMFGDRVITPHFWLELDDESIVDYKTRMWLGKLKGVPHGIFHPDEYPEARYEGQEVADFTVSEMLFTILTT